MEIWELMRLPHMKKGILEMEMMIMLIFKSKISIW